MAHVSGPGFRPRPTRDGVHASLTNSVNSRGVFFEDTHHHQMTQARRARVGLFSGCLREEEGESGSAGRIRTYDQPINSRLLYH